MFLTSINMPEVPLPEALPSIDGLKEGLLNSGFLVGAIALAISVTFLILVIKNKVFHSKKDLIVVGVLLLVMSALAAFTAASLSNINRDINEKVAWINDYVKASDDAKALAESKIVESYDLDPDVAKFEHLIEDRKLVESSTQYTNSKTNTRYDLTFTFNEKQEPILLKTSSVTDELVNELKK